MIDAVLTISSDEDLINVPVPTVCPRVIAPLPAVPWLTINTILLMPILVLSKFNVVAVVSVGVVISKTALESKSITADVMPDDNVTLDALVLNESSNIWYSILPVVKGAALPVVAPPPAPIITHPWVPPAYVNVNAAVAKSKARLAAPPIINSPFLPNTLVPILDLLEIWIESPLVGDRGNVNVYAVDCSKIYVLFFSAVISEVTYSDGNPLPPSPPFKAYDAVTAYDDVPSKFPKYEPVNEPLIDSPKILPVMCVNPDVVTSSNSVKVRIPLAFDNVGAPL